MSKYAVGDKVLVEGEIREIQNSDCNEYPYRVLVAGLQRIHFSEDELRDASKTYSDGLNDAWELARQIVLDDGMECDTFMKIFGIFSGYEEVLRTMTPQEALAKIEAYEESKAIKIGDVVEHFGKPVVVTRVSDDYTVVDAVGMGGFAKSYRVCECKKTSRHIDISSLLEQIRGE